MGVRIESDKNNWRECAKWAEARIAELEADNAALRGALRPFADMEICRDGFGNGESLDLIWGAAVYGRDFTEDETESLNKLFRQASAILDKEQSDG